MPNLRFIASHAAQAAVVSAVLLLAPVPAAASGFALYEQSPRLAGTAYAGAGSRAVDATTIFFNPAGMTRLDRSEIVLGVHAVLSDVEFQGTAELDRTHPLLPPPLRGFPIAGATAADGGQDDEVPNLFWVHAPNRRWRFGLGVSAPFGLGTEYDRGWVGRYHALRSELITVSVNPSVAYRVSPGVSIGLGVQFLYADARLSQAVDFGFLGAIQGLPGAVPGDPSFDGIAETRADDWGLGWNLGLLFEVTPRTRCGLSYRSGVRIEFEGETTFQVPAVASLLTAGGAFQTTPTTADIKLPQTLNASVTHELSDRWTVMGDLSWTGWSRLDELAIEFENPAQPTSTTPLGWDDTWRLSGGLAWRPTEALELRAGAALDEGVSSDPELRIPRLPDSDRTWLTAGLGYRFGDFELDVAWAHIVGEDAEIDAPDPTSGAVPGFHRLQGTFESSADVISLQVQWRFGAPH